MENWTVRELDHSVDLDVGVHAVTTKGTGNHEFDFIAFCPRKADADQIAALPDLLEVCKKMARLRSGPTKNKRAEWISKILTFSFDAIAAIAKAKPL